MAKLAINFGTPPLGIGGDTYKSAFEKCNLNFTELYKEFGTGWGLTNGQSPTNISVTELNDGSKWRSGVYRYSDTTLPGNYGSVVRLGGGTSGTNGGWYVDVAYTTNGTVHLRYKTNGTSFGAWVQQADVNSTVAAATKLATARTINGVSFNGTANITVADSTKLPLSGGTLTGRLAVDVANGGIELGKSDAANTPFVDFHSGATNCDYDSRILANGGTGVSGAGALTYTASGGHTFVGKIIASGGINAPITGNASTATTLQTARTINGVSFNGSANITVADGTKLPLSGGTLTGGLTIKGTAAAAPLNVRGIQGTTEAGVAAGGGLYLNNVNTTVNTYFNGTTHYINGGTYTGNAATATKLNTARTINGVSFNGSANITVPVSITGISTNGANLNTFQTAGFFACSTSAVAASLLNCPTKNAFSLLVEQHAGVKQTVTEYMASGHKTYIRNMYSGSWGAWARVYTSIDAPTGGQYIGNAATKAIAFNAQTIAENITIPATSNGLSAGPITINNGFTVTITTGGTWTIV